MQHVPAQLADADNRTWIDLDRASNLLNLRENTIRGLIRSGKIKSQGDGRGMRVLLGDVRSYDATRDKVRSEGAKKAWLPKPPKEIVTVIGVPDTMPDPVSPEPTLMTMQAAAEHELATITERLTTLLVRKAELEEALAAFAVVFRFAKLDGAQPDSEGQGV